MAYQVIARKWRPKTFADVVGQNHITQTLANALKNGRIHHALLFTGPRGTGKTSSARILAKSLRCPRAVDFVPCNTCSSCVEVALGRSLDVQELDAASNNSVDDIRKLLEGVMSSPSSGQWKIYIVDEVHMLSTSAFNALLKTLEEPPAHVLFILATTEVHKIPETILSRCQRFDFKRIPTRQIVDQLRHICETDSVKADDESLWLIARQGDGSMRDAQSLLDQVITFSHGALERASVTRILGLTDRSLLYDCLKALISRDTQGTLKVIESLSTTGLEPRLFAQEMLESLRHLLIVKISTAQMSSILDLPDSELKDLAELGAGLSEEEIHLLFEMAMKGANDLPRSQDPRLVLEVLLLRMASAPRIVDLRTLLGQPQPRGDLHPASRAQSASLNRTAPAAPAPPPPVPKPKTMARGATPPEKWLNFVELVRMEDPLFTAKIENLLFTGEESRRLRLVIPPRLVFLKEQTSGKAFLEKLKGFIDSLWGEGYSFEIVAGKDAPGGESAQNLAARKRAAEQDQIRQQVADHPLVRAAQNVFSGEIKSITPVKEGANK